MTEDLLRRALERQADRAPDSDRVRAGLPRYATVRSRRRFGTLAGGLVAAAALTAVAVPVLSLDGGGVGPREDAGAAPVTAQRTTVGAVALKYRPTWLPAGLAERSRTVPMGPGNPYDGPVRIFKPANAAAGFDMGGPRLEFGAIAAKDGVDQFGDHGEQVDINGRPGRLSPGGKSSLHWLVDPQTVIFIHNVEAGLSNADLVKIARSVQADPGQLPVQVGLGWLPTGMAPFSAQVAGDSPTTWQLEVTAMSQTPVPTPTSKNDKESRVSGEGWVYVRLGTTSDAPAGGEPATVGGRPARIATRPADGPVPGDHTYVVVDLASGLQLTVYALVPEVTRADLVAVAEGVEVGATPDLSWLGAATR